MPFEISYINKNDKKHYRIPLGHTVAIVMRYEGGGSLRNAFNPAMTIARKPLTLSDKIHILRECAKGLHQLHSIGIFHGDIKPDNILLSHHSPPLIRLADFGQAAKLKTMKTEDMFTSVLHNSNTARGTPIYSAPELISHDGTISYSRKTDIYAFAILCWECLSGEVPFNKTYRNNFDLQTAVKAGMRPDIGKLIDTPYIIKDMITACWDVDRTKRYTAVKCYHLLDQIYLKSNPDSYDIFFSHPWINKNVLSYVKYFLSSAGYKVWYDENDLGYDLKKSMKDGIEKSTVVLVCLNQTYENRENCMFELKHASHEKKTIVTLGTHTHHFYLITSFTSTTISDRTGAVYLGRHQHSTW